MTYAVGNALQVAVGDMNGDGRLDLVVGNNDGHTVSVLIGWGDGTFQAPMARGIGVAAGTLALEDVNGDGRLDLVAAADVGDYVLVLFGQGDGTFSTERAYSVGDYVRRVAAADVNADGHVDLIALKQSGNNIAVLLGRGDGTFQTPLSSAAGHPVWFVAASDLNRDGNLDLVTAGERKVSVLFGLGDGTFHSPVTTVSGVDGLITSGDVNADGRLDLVMPTGDRVWVLLGSADGTFETLGAYASGASKAVTLGDLNGDRRLDVVTVSSASSNVAVLRGLGDGTFESPPTAVAAYPPTSITVGDVNGDGFSDLIAAENARGAVSISLGTGNGTFQGPVTHALGYVPRAFAVGDVNADGRLDLVTVSDALNVSVYQELGDGTFQKPMTSPLGYAPQAISLRDADSDGRLDLIAANSLGDSVAVLRGLGDGKFQAPVTCAVGDGPQTVAAGDLNGDGHLDLVTANRYSASLSVLLGLGGGAFRTLADHALGDAPWAVEAGDLNGDGHLDLVTLHPDSKGLLVLRGRGDGTFHVPVTYVLPHAAGTIQLLDFNGDGHLDLITASEAGGNVRVLLGAGDGTFPTRRSYVGGTPRLLALGDLNGDGRTDLITVGSTSGKDSIWTLLARAPETFQTRNLPIHFTAVFNEPVAGFAADDVLLGGTAPGSREVTVTRLNATSYDVAVSGLTGDGTVTMRIAAGAATDIAGNPSRASTSTDAGASYDVTPPTVTVSQAVGQADPTRAAPLLFTVAFSEPVAGFLAGDIVLGGTAPGAMVSEVTPLDAQSYLVVVGGLTGPGTVTVTIPAGAVRDAAGNPSGASTSKDNELTYDATTVTIAPAAGQSALTHTQPIHFTVEFSRPVTDFTAEDVLLGGVAPGQPAATVTPLDATTYDVAVSGLTGRGTVTAHVVAGAAMDGMGSPSLASSNADNVVVYDVTPPTVTINQPASLEAHGLFPGEVFLAGSQPVAVVSADLNGDGHWDVVTANADYYSGNSVSVLLGRGDGMFEPASEFKVGRAPLSVAIGDVNQDGYGDAVTANGYDKTISVLAGAGRRNVPAAVGVRHGRFSGLGGPGRCQRGQSPGRGDGESRLLRQGLGAAGTG